MWICQLKMLLMDKNEVVEILNAMNRGIPISFQDKLLLWVSDYLTEIKFANSDKIINFLIKNPDMIRNTIPTLVEYYRKKYNICYLVINNKILKYYE